MSTLAEELEQAASAVETAASEEDASALEWGEPTRGQTYREFAARLRARADRIRELRAAFSCPAWCGFNAEVRPEHEGGCPRGLVERLTGPPSTPPRRQGGSALDPYEGVNLARRERTTSPVAAKRIIEARDAEWAASTPGSGSR